MTNKELKKCNALLASELGYNPYNKGIYQWHWSENLFHPRRDVHSDGTYRYDYEADPQSGLVLAKPKYVLRKLCPMLEKQWVLCMWMASGSFDEWQKEYGNKLEWPRQGWLAPTNVDLAPGITPNDSVHGLTWNELIINLYKEQRKKSYADHYRDGEAIVAAKEKATDSKMDEIIGEARLPFDHVPGKKDHVSIPTVPYKSKLIVLGEK